jgi:hypothetical protein
MEKTWKNYRSLETINTLFRHIAKWPNVESEVKKNWTTDQRHCVFKNGYFGVRRWEVTHGITDFAGTVLWCYRFVKRHLQITCI